MEAFNLDSGIVITEDMEEVEEANGKQIFFVPIWKWFLCRSESVSPKDESNNSPGSI